jgi:hypothetical protein
MRYVIEGKIEGGMVVTGGKGRTCKQLLDEEEKTRGCWKLKEEKLDCTLWRIRFGRGYGHVVRQTME